MIIAHVFNFFWSLSVCMTYSLALDMLQENGNWHLVGCNIMVRDFFFFFWETSGQRFMLCIYIIYPKLYFFACERQYSMYTVNICSAVWALKVLLLYYISSVLDWFFLIMKFVMLLFLYICGAFKRFLVMVCITLDVVVQSTLFTPIHFAIHNLKFI